MFTGLIQSVGTIVSLAEADGSLRITVDAPGLAPSLKVGDSIAVSGVCLTALEPTPTQFEAELAVETIERTSLTRLAPGAKVNLELPTPAGTPLGGHVVQGHVDATGTLLALDPVTSGDRSDWVLRIAVPPAVGRFVVEKGSIAIEGISLTVARWFPEKDGADDTFTGSGEVHVAVIPHTYKATNLHSLSPGSPINLEADVLMKLAAQNNWTGAPQHSAWTTLATQDTATDTPFDVTAPWLVAHGY